MLSSLSMPKGPVTNFIRTFIEILSSTISRVVGLLWLLDLVVQRLSMDSLQVPDRQIFNLPQMTRNVETVFKTRSTWGYRSGSFLEFLKLETVVAHVVIPEALPGIVTCACVAYLVVPARPPPPTYTAGQSASSSLDWLQLEYPQCCSALFNLPTQAEKPWPSPHIWKVNSEGTIRPDATIVSVEVLPPCSLIFLSLLFNF